MAVSLSSSEKWVQDWHVSLWLWWGSGRCDPQSGRGMPAEHSMLAVTVMTASYFQDQSPQSPGRGCQLPWAGTSSSSARRWEDEAHAGFSALGSETP